MKIRNCRSYGAVVIVEGSSVLEVCLFYIYRINQNKKIRFNEISRLKTMHLN